MQDITLKKCIGIISYLPDAWISIFRQNALTNLLKQLGTIWPNIDILIITQNWKNYQVPDIKNKIIRFDYPTGLGISKARKILREEFLKLDYDYLIMLDDDESLEVIDDAASRYLEELDKHPDGFCFMPPTTSDKNDHSNEHPYGMGQFNLCAISRYILSKEPLVSVNAEKNEGFEDSIYACLLYHKYRQYEFKPASGIRCLHFNKIVPSTWSLERTPDWKALMKNTYLIQKYIVEHKELPPELLNDRA